MSSLLVRRLDDDVKQRLRERALRHGRSLEAEVREILASAASEGDTSAACTKPAEVGFGTLMQEHFGKRGLTPAERRRLEQACRELADRSEMTVPDVEEW